MTTRHFSRLRLHSNRYAYALAAGPGPAPTPAPTPTPTPTPTVSISSAQSKSEGNSGTTAYVYTVTRSAAAGAVNVPWAFAAGGTSAADFVGGVLPEGGVVALADGVASGTITLSVQGDAVLEGDETFTVSIAAPAGYALGSPTSATGTILNDDAAVVGGSATSFTTAPQTHFHPHQQAGAVTKSGSVVTACPDLRGLAALSAGTGPVEMTDALGRKFWRFEGTAFAQIANAFAANTRGVSFVLVGRIHKSAGAMISCGLNGAAPATSTGLMATYNTSAAPFVMRPLGILSTGDAANRKFMACGNQLAVYAVRAGDTAAGGQRCYVNNDRASVAQASLSAAFSGLELGRFANTGASYGSFDLYEVAFWNTGLASAAMDAAVAEAVAHWQIPQLTASLYLEGDSRVHGVNSDVTTGTALGMVLSTPGAGFVPANVRVINMAASGNQISHMVTRRDSASPGAYAADMQLAGEAHIVFLMGANDGAPSGDANYSGTTFNTAARGDAITAAEKAMLYTGSGTGFLEKNGGKFTVTRMVEPITQASPSVSILQQRVGIRAASYLTDTQSGPGQAYDGKLRRIELPNITIGGLKPFDQPSDLPNVYMDGDGVHPSKLGVQLYASGGDTPALGWGAAV